MLRQQRQGEALLSSDKMLVECVPGIVRTHSRRALCPMWLWFQGASRGEAKAAALHTDFQAICRLTACVDDATVHITRQVTVATLF